MIVNIFGATGLVGGHLLTLCLQHPAITAVKVFVRKPVQLQHPKLEQITTDFEGLEQVRTRISGEVVFNCLGTTLKQAGSQAAQYIIDCEYPVKVARLAAANGVSCMISVSSIGTSPTGNFYLKTKADMENGVQKAIGKKAYFIRPSFILGDRKAFRLGEKIGIALMVFINPLLLGGLRKYRSIHAEVIAKAMLQLALKQPESPTVLYYDDILLANDLT
jgi:uncharacterized protein YbjT (DUF2867 family)